MGLSLLTVLAATTLMAAMAGPLKAATDGELFEDATEASGLSFRHWNGRTGALYFPEMTGQGAALFDYDGDGDLDVYLLQGAHLQLGDRGKTTEPPPEAEPRDRLFRNQGPNPQDGVPRFVDVTRESKIVATGYGMGVASGDFDNDGHIDLFVANVGKNELWRNRGDGTFENVAAKAGVEGSDSAWSVGATFFDADADGALDLFVIDYVRYRVSKNITCFSTSSRKDYCGPSAFPPAPNFFFRNRGDGTFSDDTKAAGIAGTDGASLGVVAADFDADGRMDLYVANDGQPNHLWLQHGKEGIAFRDEALLAGVALNREGQPEASMGVSTGDVDGDGDLDLFMTHLMGETNTLYLASGPALFDDRTIEMGLAVDSVGLTSFGTGFLDVDNDGWLDLFVASGAVKVQEDLLAAGDSFPLGQPNQLFLRRGARFVDATDRASASFRNLEVGRGAAFGDVDNDGDTDILLTNNLGPARLLLNKKGQGAPWLGVRAVVPGAGGQVRDALGAQVRLLVGSAAVGVPKTHLRRVATDGSYASASDPRVIFGLAGVDTKALEGIVVTWPDGLEERFPVPTVGRYQTVRRGQGKVQSAGTGKTRSRPRALP